VLLILGCVSSGKVIYLSGPQGFLKIFYNGDYNSFLERLED
jgi:hypothetical protein